MNEIATVLFINFNNVLHVLVVTIQRVQKYN